MEKVREFNRCIYCFEEKENKTGVCLHCGYENGYCDLPGWWLIPGTIVKGRYVVGKALEETDERLVYLGWDLKKEYLVEVTEYFPKVFVTRDITDSENVSCISGLENAFQNGKQEFFEKAKTFFQCIVRVEDSQMDFFVRNNTCYYVRKKSAKLDKIKEKAVVS